MKEASSLITRIYYSATQKITKEKPLKTTFIYVALIYITLYDLQSIFNFVATDIPSNNTEAWILKFCFLVVFFHKFNDRNVKMINLWEIFFSMHFTNTVGISWFWLPSVNRNWIFLSQLKWFWASKPPSPNLHHYTTVMFPPATRNHDPALTNRFHTIVHSNWSGDRHRLKLLSKTEP